MMPPLPRRTLVAFTLLSIPSAWSGTYYLPANTLESSEVRGAQNLNRIEAGVQSGTVFADPTPSFALDANGKPLSPTIPHCYAMPFVGAEISLNDETEIGGRIQALSGIDLRIKRQFTGFPAATAQKANFSMSGVASFGMTMGVPPKPNYISTQPDQIASGSSLLYYVKIALPAGYRVNERHLALLIPNISLGGLSNAGSLSGSATQFGISVGWQYEIAALFVRAEAGYAQGSFLGGSTAFIPLGVSTGLNF